ncbi:MAG: hypothetical protein PHQ74_02875 [Crocinitomicaceae bacterium]|nr:hypothetical protein [Crocinitomicaceae bacterium]
MAAKVSEALHELIKYLTKSEKRYFKLFSARHVVGTENNYVILFDFIDSQVEYDENSIFEHFKGQAFLNKFSITKKRLYDQIINSLDSFHASTSISAQVYKLLHSADILYNKSLYDQSRRQLRSAEKLALKHEMYNLLSEINLKYKRLAENNGVVEEEERERILQTDILAQSQNWTYNTFWNIKSKLFALLHSKGVSRTQADLDEFKTILTDLEIAKEKSEATAASDYLYNHIHAAYHFAIGSFQTCYSHLNQNISLFEQNKSSIQEHPNQYFSILTNAIYIANKLKKNGDSDVLLKKLKDFNTDIENSNNQDLKIKLFASSSSIELTILSMKGDLKTAFKVIPQIEKGLIDYETKLTSNRRAFLYFKIASIYFISGDMHEALKKINQILNDRFLDKQEDILSFAQIINLLIHFEMENDQLLSYTIRNTQRFLKNKNRLYAFEEMFLKFLNKANSAESKVNQNEIIEDLYLQISNLKDNDLQKVAFEYFDFAAWAESKVHKKSLQNLIQNQYEMMQAEN